MIRRRSLSAFLVAAFLVAAFLAAASAAFAVTAATSEPIRTHLQTKLRTATAADGREAYIVVFREAPTARSKARMTANDAARVADLRANQDSFASDMVTRIAGFQAGARYQRVLNGMAVLVAPGGLETLQADPRVRAVYPVRKYRLHLDASNPLMGSPTFWSALGGDDQAGRGVKFADLDTGVDFSNPMFSDLTLPMPDGFPKENDGNTFANSKVIAAKYFQGMIDATDPGLSPLHRTAQDLSGHGSHTASVAAGAKVALSGDGRRTVTIEGVAPKAYIGDYKVFSPNAYSDNVIAAIEDATADGMNVLNMSFGINNADGTEPFLFGAAPENEAIQNAIASGIVATLSAGNSGQDANGNPVPDSISSTADVPDVIAVGASTNAHSGIAPGALGQIAMTGGNTPPPANVTAIIGAQGVHTDANGNTIGPAFPTTAIPSHVSDWGQTAGAPDDLACSAVAANALAGRIVLVQRGTCTFQAKVTNAQTAGAVAVVIYNKADGSDGGDQLLSPATGPTLIPSILIGRTDGLNLKAYLDANGGNPPSATGAFGPVPPGTPPFVTPTPSRDLAGFSSIGPTLDLRIKPDLTSIGTGSYAAAQDDSALGDGRFHDDYTDEPFYDPSGFAFGDGTSFSAPRVAGGAVLLIQKHPTWSPAEIKAALMETSARPTDANDALKVGNLSVMQRGSGDADLGAASTVGSLVLPANYSYGRVAFNTLPAGNALDRVFTLENRSAASVTYALSASPSAGFSDPAITPSVSPTTMTLGPGQSGTFTLSLALGAGLTHGQRDSEGTISVTDGGASIPGALSVPYWVRMAFPAGHPPIVESASSTYTAAQDQLDVIFDAHDDDADLSSFTLAFWDASGEFLGTATDTFSDVGVDTSKPDLSLDLQIPTFTAQTGFGCAPCVAVSVSVTDKAGNVSNDIFTRFGAGVDAEAVPAASDGVYQRSLPLVAHVQGAQFLFQSDVRLFNPDAAHILNLDAYFVPQGESGAHATHVVHQLLPRQSLPLNDLVQNDFLIPSGIGSLVVVSADGHAFLASSRAYDTNAAGGTFGTFAGSVTPAKAVGAADGTVSANGFPTAAGFHTNVGATEVTGADTVVRFQGFDTSGASVGAFTETVPAYSNLQFNPIADASHHFSAPAARVSFTVLSGGRILPYAAAVDEGSGDTLLSIASPAPESDADVVVTGAGRVHGAAGTFFTSDLSITNGSGGPRTVDLSLLPSAGLGAPPSPLAPITLAAGETKVLADVLQSAFGYATDAVAGIRIHPESPASLVASVRTSTPNNAGAGAYGFFVNGTGTSGAVSGGGKAVSIHLEHDSAFRTNFGFTEVAGSAVTVRATFFDENGTPLGTRAYAVPADGFLQTSAADLLGAASAGNGYIEFTIDSGDGAALCFATVVDDVTGDSIYVPAEPES